MSTPEHIAIIMDGNGRWARKRALPAKAGHKKGAETLRALLEDSKELGFRFLTVYAFSSENWQRSEKEVADLMALLHYYIEHEVNYLHEHNIKLNFIGDRSMLDSNLQVKLKAAEHKTEDNTALTLIIALSYGGRQEIARAAVEYARELQRHSEIPSHELAMQKIASHLDTHAWPDPDLLIRTGGEQRLSNFLLWQCAYTELYFSDILWPDFTAEHLKAAIEDYAARERRFGKRDASAEPRIVAGSDHG